MKKSLLAPAALAVLGAFAGSAQAESNVTMYGVVDAGLMSQTNSSSINNQFALGLQPVNGNSNMKNGTATGFMASGQSMDRVGIKGSEDLGGGLKALFQLETGFNLGTGLAANSGLAGNGQPGKTLATAADTSLEGQLLNRMAMVGLSGDWGMLTGGRQLSFGADLIGGKDYDAVNAQMFSPINFSGAYGGGGATDGSRVDNSYAYTQNFGPVNFRVMVAPGGVAGASSARSTQALNVGYENPTFGVQALYSKQTDTTGLGANAAPSTVNVTWQDTQMYMLAGKYRPTDKLTLKLGYENMKIMAPSNPTTDTQVSTIYTYSIGTQNTTAFSYAPKVLHVTWLGANYQFTPAIKGSLGYYNVNISSFGSSAATLAPSGVAKFESAFIEYAFSKRTNAYAGIMVNRNSDGAQASNNGGTIATPVASTTLVGIGMRHAF